ncbi:MAG: hypothetical protein ACRDFX_04670 [Chloroflexota bacterium]
MPLEALHVLGPYRGVSGYEHHVREFVAELHNQNIAIQLTETPEWSRTSLPGDMLDPWFDSLSQPVGARIALHFCPPHQVRPVPKCLNVNYSVFEATRVPAHWVARNRTHDLLIVPTESSRMAWLNSGMPATKIAVIPEGINPRLFSGIVPPLRLQTASGESVARYKTRFLNVSEIGPRKNLPGLLSAWLRATHATDDAVLILKVAIPSFGWDRVLIDQIEAAQAGVGKRLQEAAPLVIVTEIFADQEMPRLFASATHYISMSHGEGWDQPMVEAGSSGLQLIAPNHSAYTSYLDGSCAHLIPSREIPPDFGSDTELQALFSGSSWWQPDEVSAVELIRGAIDGSLEPKVSPRERFLTELSWERSTRKLVALLDDLQQRKRPFWRIFRRGDH